MQTSAISNLINSPSGPSASKTADEASSLPFNTVLSREMADRNTASASAKQVDNQAKTPQSSAPKNTTPSNNGNTTQTPAPDKSQNETVAKDAPVDAAKNKTASADDQHQEDNTEDSNALSAASNELIALVANLNQPRATAADVSKDKPDSAADASDKQAVQDVTDVTLAQSALAAQAATASTPAPEPASATPATTTPKALDALAAGGNNKPAPVTISTTTEHAILTKMAPAPDRLKTDTSATGKQSGEASQKFDPSALRPDKSTANEQALINSQTGPDNGDKPAFTEQENHASRTSTQVPAASANTTAVNPLTNPAVAALNQVQAAAAQAVQHLAPRVGTEGWNQALGQKVVWMANGEQQSASLTLNPPDLGPLQVVLSVTNNHATANFTAAQPEVRQALESAMPKLREMLGDAGIQLGQTNVSAGTPNQHQNPFHDAPRQSARQSSSLGDTVDTPLRTARVQPAKGGAGMVDTFV